MTKENGKTKTKKRMEVERTFVTSYPATISGLLNLFLHYCTATATQRNDNIKTDQTHPNLYGHFSHILGRMGLVFYFKYFFALR